MRIIAISLTLVFLAACAGPPPPPPPFRPVADIHGIMENIVYPNADGYWKSVATIITEEGTQEIQPRNDEEWEAVVGYAYTLTEVGNLLLMKEREREEHVWPEGDIDWVGYAQAMIDAGETAIKAAESKNPQAVFDAGGELYVACRNCHGKYLHEPGAPGATMEF